MAESSHDGDEGEILDAVPVSLFDEWRKRMPTPVEPAPTRPRALSVRQVALISFLLGAWLFGRD